MVNILHAKAAGCCQTSSLIGGFVGRHAKAVKTSQRRLRGSHYRPACNGFGPPRGLVAARSTPVCTEILIRIDIFLVRHDRIVEHWGVCLKAKSTNRRDNANKAQWVAGDWHLGVSDLVYWCCGIPLLARRVG
jgi:hypothetical protein